MPLDGVPTGETGSTQRVNRRDPPPTKLAMHRAYLSVARYQSLVAEHFVEGVRTRATVAVAVHYLLLARDPSTGRWACFHRVTGTPAAAPSGARFHLWQIELLRAGDYVNAVVLVEPARHRGWCVPLDGGHEDWRAHVPWAALGAAVALPPAPPSPPATASTPLTIQQLTIPGEMPYGALLWMDTCLTWDKPVDVAATLDAVVEAGAPGRMLVGVAMYEFHFLEALLPQNEDDLLRHLDMRTEMRLSRLREASTPGEDRGRYLMVDAIAAPTPPN